LRDLGIFIEKFQCYANFFALFGWNDPAEYTCKYEELRGHELSFAEICIAQLRAFPYALANPYANDIIIMDKAGDARGMHTRCLDREKLQTLNRDRTINVVFRIFKDSLA
jgi:hypothetical protein